MTDPLYLALIGTLNLTSFLQTDSQSRRVIIERIDAYVQDCTQADLSQTLCILADILLMQLRQRRFDEVETLAALQQLVDACYCRAINLN